MSLRSVFYFVAGADCDVLQVEGPPAAAQAKKEVKEHLKRFALRKRVAPALGC